MTKILRSVQAVHKLQVAFRQAKEGMVPRMAFIKEVLSSQLSAECQKMLQSKKFKKAKASKETEKLHAILQNPNTRIYEAIAYEYLHNVCKRYFTLKYFIYMEA